MSRSPARSRRGCRLAIGLPLMLHWREPQGAWREVPAQTRLLSRHGCLLACSARITLHDEVMVWWLEKNRYTQARVVFRSVAAGEEIELALEFLGNEDFWTMDFSRGIVPQHPGAAPSVLHV